MDPTKLDIAVVIASKARSKILSNLVPFLNMQTVPPKQLILVVTEPEDIDFDLVLAPNIRWEIRYAPPGLTKQRNVGLDHLDEGVDIVVFFDDDFLPSRFTLEGIARAFAESPDVSGMSGHLLADGINSEGIEFIDAKEMIEAWDARHLSDGGTITQSYSDQAGLYGCNMAIRLSAIGGLRFDERLPAYGWLEDLDFGAQLPGRKVVTNAFAGVHLGTRVGRETNGERLGYSQMVNPYYLCNKGSVSRSFALSRTFKNFVANLIKSVRPEPWVDRAARLRGNFIGIRDLFTGEADPQMIEHWDRIVRIPKD